MPKLTIVASNRDRFDPNSNATKWFIKSLQWQTYKDFEILLADGFSKNYEEIKAFLENYGGDIPMRIVQFPIGEAFERARLNNVGIRNALGEYVMTTDVDMSFGKDFVQTLMGLASPDSLVESRTLYWHPNMSQKIYNGELDLYNDIQVCRAGRIKKRTSAGGCQCMHMDGWNKVRGFDEKGYIGWGSEDTDLLTRCKYAGIKIKWMGETGDVALFHQWHPKNIKEDLTYQAENKKTLAVLQLKKYFRVNDGGWGGVLDH